MKLYAPKYYKDFACIADKCTHSCCIGWEIDVDNATLSKYRNSSHNYAKDVLSSIDTEETPHFRLVADERCPHLDKSGLCKIILNLGEEYLCDICREHPRFYNNANQFREVGLGMACEEACRLILGSDDYNVFVEVDELSAEPIDSDFDAVLEREKVYKILSDDSLSYIRKLESIYSEYCISPSEIPDSQWLDIITSLEYLDETHKNLFSSYSSQLSEPSLYEKPLERALAYFVFRHCTEAQDETEFRISLGFCLFCERLLASLLREGKTKEQGDIIRLAQTVSEEIEYSEDNTESIKFELSLL